MSDLKFKKLEGELDDLVTFMINNPWSYHSDPKPSDEQIKKRYHEGWYQEDRETYWVETNNEKIGIIIIHDISDIIPSFDIRLANHVRGKGIGTEAVKWLTDYIFGLSNRKIRIEAYTRSDNLSMRKTLSKAGFV